MREATNVPRTRTNCFFDRIVLVLRRIFDDLCWILFCLHISRCTSERGKVARMFRYNNIQYVRLNWRFMESCRADILINTLSITNPDIIQKHTECSCDFGSSSVIRCYWLIMYNWYGRPLTVSNSLQVAPKGHLKQGTWTGYDMMVYQGIMGFNMFQGSPPLARAPVFLPRFRKRFTGPDGRQAWSRKGHRHWGRWPPLKCSFSIPYGIPQDKIDMHEKSRNNQNETWGFPRYGGFGATQCWKERSSGSSAEPWDEQHRFGTQLGLFMVSCAPEVWNHEPLRCSFSIWPQDHPRS